jgi:hypothetical protein
MALIWSVFMALFHGVDDYCAGGFTVDRPVSGAIR